MTKEDQGAAPPQSKRLTEQERKKLAAEARRFAMECVDGTEPRLGQGRLWYRDGRPCCAVGHILARAGLHPEWADEIGAMKDLVVATAANDHYPDALPFALLALADALEDASKTPKKDL